MGPHVGISEGGDGAYVACGLHGRGDITRWTRANLTWAGDSGEGADGAGNYRRCRPRAAHSPDARAASISANAGGSGASLMSPLNEPFGA